MPEPLLCLEDVWYAYPGGVEALCGVSLQVAPGARLAIIGRTGSGKTTLARHLNGLLRPTRGRVLVQGLDTVQHDVGTLAALVGYVFQNPDHQHFNRSVREELAFGPRNLGLEPAEIERRVEDALRRFQLEAQAEIPPAVLGFAQRRQVAVAAVVTMRPAALVLDEPFAGLSWPAAERLGQLLVTLAAAGQAVVVITHQMRAVARFAERAVVLEAGQILADGPVRAILTDADLLARAALAPPVVTRLGARLRNYGLSGRAILVDELVVEYRRLRASEGTGQP